MSMLLAVLGLGLGRLGALQRKKGSAGASSFVLREDSGYVLREDGSRIVRETF